MLHGQYVGWTFLSVAWPICRTNIHVRRMANNSDMNVQATGIATAHLTRNFSTAVLSAFRFQLSTLVIVMFSSTEFPLIASAIQDGIDRQLHTGVQIYVSLDSAVVVAAPHGLRSLLRVPVSVVQFGNWEGFMRCCSVADGPNPGCKWYRLQRFSR